MSVQAIFNYPSLHSPILFHRGRVIHLDEFLQTLHYLDKKLPHHQHLLNLYEDRYYFLLGFCLGLKRQSISLFPSTITSHVLTHLKQQYDDILVLTDEEIPDKELQQYHLSDWLDSNDLQLEESDPSDWQNCLPAVELEQEIAIIFTSGSTGQPKPYRKLWGDLVQVAKLLANQFILHRGQLTSAAILATVPAQHMYGLESSIMMAIQNGLLIHSSKPFFPQDITHCLEDLLTVSDELGHTVSSTVITTPLHLKACIKTSVSLPGIHQFISATAPLDKELAKICEQKYSVPVKEIFGCTEVGSIACRRTIASEQWTVLDDISLQPANEDGEVEIYTGRSIKQFPFNDVIDLLDAKHFILQGRKEDVINLAGKRTSLAYLNYHLQSFNELSDACFYQDQSVADGRLVAFVVLDNDTIKDSQQKITELKEYLKDKIEMIFLPKKIFIVDSLPRNATGKLPIAELKKLFLQQDKS